jgi:hypothetical protein
MNNFQKISSAALLLATCLGLTACEQNDPNKGTCISYPENDNPCGKNTPSDSKRYCPGGNYSYTYSYPC